MAKASKHIIGPALNPGTINSGKTKVFREMFSYSKKPSKSGTVKHLVTKTERFSNDALEKLMQESQLSRILHKIDPYAAKTKLIHSKDPNILIIGSRLYPLDKVKGFIGNFLKNNNKAGKTILNNYNLHDIIIDKYKNNELDNTKFEGLLNKLVYRIILEDWDNKLLNMDGYEFGNVVRVGLIDCALSLGKGRDIHYKIGNESYTATKSWRPDEIMSLVRGTHTKSGRKNIAEALVETTDLGTRTSSFYMDSDEAKAAGMNKNPAMRAACKLALQKSISAELSAINKDHRKALISTFERVLADINRHRGMATVETIEDTKGKVNSDRVAAIGNEINSQLGERVKKFHGYIQDIKAKLNIKPEIGKFQRQHAKSRVKHTSLKVPNQNWTKAWDNTYNANGGSSNKSIYPSLRSPAVRSF